MLISILHRAQVVLHIVLLFTLASYSFAANSTGTSTSATDKTASITAEAEAGFFDRRASLKRMGAPSYIDNSYQKSKSYDVLAATALKGCGPAEWPAYMASLSTLPVSYPPDGPVEMFSLPPLVRYLYQFGDCMTAAQKQKLLFGFTSQKQYLTGHGTLNHAIMRATSWYLLAQYFPEAKWTHWDGKVYTSPQLMSELKRLMAGRKSRFYKSGQYEWLSPTYAMVDFFPLLNLIDFAADPEVRMTAEEEATLEVAVLKADSFYGVTLPPLTRIVSDQRNGLDWPADYGPAITQHILWYYFGEPSALGLYDFQPRNDPFYASMLGLSDWRPPAKVAAIDPALLGAYNIKVTTPGFGIWDAETVPQIYGDSYIADDFAVGTGNQLFDPGGYSGHIQTFSILLRSDQPQNQIECYHPFWKSNAGEDAWGGDRSSPFQQMYRYDKSSVVMLFDIPKRDPWVFSNDNRFFPERNMHKDALLQLAECRIAKSFDEIVKERNWVFVRQGKVFVAMATLLGDYEYDHAPVKLTSKFLIVKVHEPRTALFFRVERETPEMTFAQFRESVRKQLPVYDESSSSVALTEQSGVRTQVKFKLQPDADGKRWAAIPEVLHNGKPVPQDNNYVINSPVMTLKDGVLTINSASQRK